MNRSESTLPGIGVTDDLSRTTMSSPVGELTLIAGPGGLRAVLWPNELDEPDRLPLSEDGDRAAATVLRRTIIQLGEYFAGDRQEFDLPLDPVGTEFQQSAWLQLQLIPYGATISYGEQARRLGDVRKSRAVGAANGRNPISIIVPCHRVIGANGSLTGFAAGIEAKSWLLRHEQGTLTLLD